MIAGAALVLLTLPWLNPAATGPAPAATPLLVSWMCFAGLLFVCSFSFQSLESTKTRAVETLATAWWLAALASCGIALIQFFGYSKLAAGFINTTQIGEAFANLRQRNQFATLTMIGLVAIIWLARAKANPKFSRDNLDDQQRMMWFWGGLASAGTLGLGNAASSSRTGLVQLLLVGGLMLAWRNWRDRSVVQVVTTAWLTYVVASVLLPVLVSRDGAFGGIFGRLADTEHNCSSRIVLWQNVLHLVLLKPWFGWGWGELDYAHFITLYDGPRFCEILDNAHNLPLHLAVELGIPVSLLFCGGVLWVLKRLHPWRENHPQRQLAWGVLAMIGLHSLVEYPLWYGPFQIATVMCLMILFTTSQETKVSAPNKMAGEPRVGSTLLLGGMRLTHVIRASAIVLMMALAAVAWDYYKVSQIYLPPSQRAQAYKTNTLEKIRNTWFFQNQFRFAELTTAQLTPVNAAYFNAQAHALLHFSPEARVVERLITTSEMLGRVDEAKFFRLRYQAAYGK